LENPRFYVMNVETSTTAPPPEPSPLTPELKDFIRRILVPLLVDRYLDKQKRATSGQVREEAVLAETGGKP